MLETRQLIFGQHQEKIVLIVLRAISQQAQKPLLNTCHFSEANFSPHMTFIISQRLRDCSFLYMLKKLS